MKPYHKKPSQDIKEIVAHFTMSLSNLSLSSADKERLLERFPLTDAELALLWPLAVDHGHNARTLPYLLQTRLPLDANPSHALLHRVVPVLWEAVLQQQQQGPVLGFEQPSDPLYQAAQGLETAVTLLGRRSEVALTTALWKGAQLGTNYENTDPTAEQVATWLYALVRAVQTMSLSTAHRHHNNATPTTPGTPPASWVASLPTTITITAGQFQQWVANVAPSVPFVLATFAHYLLLGSVARLSAPWSLPVPPENGTTGDNECLLASIETAAPLVAMGILHNKVVRSLYTSRQQGLSFHTLRQCLTSHVGATVLLIRTTQAEVLGYYTERPWHVETHVKKRQDDPNRHACLFALQPVWRRWARTTEEPVGCAQWMQRLYGASKTTAFSSSSLLVPPEGLSIGGVTADAPRLHLTPSLEQCRAVSTGRLFASGPLLGQEEDRYLFDVEEIQLFAVAPTIEALMEGQALGQQSVATKEALRKRLAQVDKRQFVDDLVFLPGHLFAHRQQTRGRADFVADDDEGRGYYIEQKPPSPHRPAVHG